MMPGVRLPVAWPNPPAGPRTQPSISAASLPVTQHPPPRSRFLRRPGNRRRRHRQRARRDAAPKTQEEAGDARTDGSSGGREIPGTGNSPSEFSGSLHAGFGRGLRRGKSRALPVPRGGKQPKAISGSNVLFSKRRDDGKYNSSASSCRHSTDNDAVLPPPARRTSHMEMAIPAESTCGLPQQHPSPPPGPRFQQGQHHRDASATAAWASPCSSPSRSAMPEFSSQTLNPHPLYPIHSYEGLPALLRVTAELKDLPQRLIALICTAWRIQPTFGHTTGWLGFGGGGC